MATIDNKDVIQSYIMTTAKYNFTVYEKRILYRLIELIQWAIEGKKLDSGYRIEKSLYDDTIITMPLAQFLRDDMDENYTRVKEALKGLRNKVIEYDDGKTWELLGIIEKPRFDRVGWVRFELQPKIYEAILNFSKGYRKYELKTAMSFDSQYAMRFYELFSGQKKPLIYTIENLKIMFGLEAKYKLTADFIRYVVEPARTELNAKAPFSFNFTPLKTGRSITALKFYPVIIPANRDKELEKAELQKQLSISWDLSPMLREYLRNSLYFSNDEIKNNIEVFKAAQNKLPDIMLELSTLKGRSREKDNQKGYIINALKGKLKDLENK